MSQALPWGLRKGRDRKGKESQGPRMGRGLGILRKWPAQVQGYLEGVFGNHLQRGAMGKGRAGSLEQDRSEFLSFIPFAPHTSPISLAELFHRPTSLHVDRNKNTDHPRLVAEKTGDHVYEHLAQGRHSLAAVITKTFRYITRKLANRFMLYQTPIHARFSHRQATADTKV